MHNKDVITTKPFLPAAKAASVFIKIQRFPPHSMAAATTTTKLIQVRPNHRCLSTFRSSSSSSSTPTPPPPDTDDVKPPPEPKSSIHQFSSYFSDVKATLNQSQSQPQMNPLFRPPAPNSSLSPPPPPKLPSLDEIGKTLRGFRHRTVPSSHPGPQPTSSFPQVSFQDNLQRSVFNSRSLGGSSLLNDEKPRTPNLNFSSIRESFNQLKLTTVNNPKLNKSMSEYQQSLKSRPPSNGGIDSNNIVTDSLPFSVFGKETGYAEDDNPAMRTEFVRYYSVKELGDELKSLRPEKKKGDNKDWFSLDELNERLAKLRQMEMEKDKTNVSTKHFEDLKFVLSEMKLQEHDKAKKESMQRLESRDILSRHGRTPSFMLEPPKEELVEKYFHPDNMSASEKLKLELQKVRDEFKMSETDCGSARVQVAQLTTKINHLASVLHKKDKHSRKGLQGMLQKRKSLLKYLRRTDWESYSFVLSRLGLRDNPEIKRS